MKAAFLLILAIWGTQIPRNNPNGVWEASTGSQFQMRLNGNNLSVQIVPGSNPRMLEYQVDLELQDELNSYKGSGSFLARLSTGKECRFDTDWEIVVVAPDRILGVTSNIIPNVETCEVQERGQVQIDLRRVD